MPEFGNASYWDERYAVGEEAYDWYQDYGSLKEFIIPYLPQNSADIEILIPGCGNSKLGADLYDSGFPNITSIDISPVVIGQMADRYADKEEMEFSTMDAKNMDLIPDNCFDVIIDKALLDSQMCADSQGQSAVALLKEMHRVMKPSGIYIVVSHAPEENRLTLLRRLNKFSVTGVAAVPKPAMKGYEYEKGVQKNHYVYYCEKN